MDEHHFEIAALLWPGGWLVALVALFWAGLSLPLETRLGRGPAILYTVTIVLAAAGVFVLANVALSLHDGHLDLTREKVYTPSSAAMRVVQELDRDVKVTFFYRSQDPAARRARDILEVMARRNPHFVLAAIDPDKEPTLARTQGIRLYNAAVLEAEGRRVLVQSMDEAEIALGIQRVLRERVIIACFLEGHGELPMDNFEFHTHLEGLTDHSHGDASSKVVEMSGHGIGRLRRALEAQGYMARQLILATRPDVPADCTVVIAASPRKTFLPAEGRALRAYLQNGGSLLLLLDLGFEPEPELAGLIRDLGVRAEPRVVVDPLSHYQTDPEMIAVMGYDPHPITRTLSLTFYPGARPLTLTAPNGDLQVVSLLASSRDSYVRPVEALPGMATAADSRATDEPPAAGSHVLGVATEGTLAGGARPLRAVVIGDGDFASNSFFPYMSNSDLLLAAIRWLAREERATAVAARIPVPPLILLTAGQTRAIFLGVVVLLPLTVVAIGAGVWWRRR